MAARFNSSMNIISPVMGPRQVSQSRSEKSPFPLTEDEVFGSFALFGTRKLLQISTASGFPPWGRWLFRSLSRLVSPKCPARLNATRNAVAATLQVFASRVNVGQDLSGGHAGLLN
jgi:hypothetical protein